MTDRILRNPQSQRILKQDQFEAAGDAASVLEQARLEAAAIVAQSRTEVERACEEGRERGYQDGLTQWNEAVRDVLNARQSYLAASEPEIVKLAVKVAEKILGAQLRLDPNAINGIVEEALRGVRADRSITIAVHPDALESVRAEVGRLESMAGADCRIRVAGRASVSAGGCIIETDFGSIDARLEVQLRCLEQILLRELRD
ncbi:MAG: type III secretion system stator protein SctL [Bryobacteraceae bacterium]